MVDRPFSLLLKPAGPDCNLHCLYCFYIGHQEAYQAPTRMPDPILQRVVQSYMATDQQLYSFAWQGGEPLLMGLDFFKKVVSYQTRFGAPGAMVSNSLQTNGTLLTEAWAEFFKAFHFLVGVSLDGPAEIHNHYRRDKNGRPSHARVVQGIQHLLNQNVDFNVLSLVNAHSVRFPKKIFKYFLRHHFHYQQYIPCIEFQPEDPAQPKSFSIQAGQWGDFLCALFDLWYPKYTKVVSIRLFDSFFEYLLFGSYNSCQFSDHCGHYFVVEHDGSVYPCDFFVEPEFYLGNIQHQGWANFLSHPIYQNFAENKHQSVQSNRCGPCRYGRFCWGGCRKHYIAHDLQKENLLCEGYKQFFDYSIDKFQVLAEDFRRQRHQGQ